MVLVGAESVSGFAAQFIWKWHIEKRGELKEKG